MNARETKIYELTGSLVAINQALSATSDAIAEFPGNLHPLETVQRALAALAVAVHRIGALTIELAQERLDSAAHPTNGNGAAPSPAPTEESGPTDPGTPRRIRAAKRRK